MATRHLYMVLGCGPKLQPTCAHAPARRTRSQRILDSKIDDLDVDEHGLCVQRDCEHATTRWLFVGTASKIIVSLQAFRSRSLPHPDEINSVIYHLIEIAVTIGRRTQKAQLAVGDSPTQKTNAHVNECITVCFTFFACAITLRFC